MRVSFDRLDFNLERAIQWLSNESYWAFGRDPELIKKSFENSIPISAIGEDGEFLGMGRLVTDHCTFGWLCDVYVSPEARGMGIGHAIVNAAIAHFDQQPKFRLLLKTRDAHGVYKDCGFEEINNPENWMAIEQGF